MATIRLIRFIPSPPVGEGDLVARVLVLVLLLFGSASAESIPLGRLPTDVTPTHYALELRIVPGEERFSGTARIDITLDRPREVIWLHGLELRVSEAVIETAGGDVPVRWEQVDPSGVVSLTSPQPVAAGRATLRFRWDAPFDRQLRGLFRIDAGGATYAFTQFEPALARRAFPSFDEPAFKTPYDVTLLVPPGAEAVSNTAILERAKADKLDRLRFATSEPLPTYLVAFAVGPLDIVAAPVLPGDEVRMSPVPFRAVAARGGGARLSFALTHSPPLFQAIETYFGIQYPFAKLDVIAVPDMAWGGMENAGAITFRESVLLLDAETAPERQRRTFASIMAHELSHQWFGDLVTMLWWDDLWLNEAFATWMAARIVEQVHPEYHSQLELLGWIHEAMNADSLASARRIRQPIDSPHDIENAFDGITYSKGAGVLGMFERWLGAEPFRRGLQYYMREHRFGSATSQDLVRALSSASQRDVAPAFGSFLDQPGVPLVTADLVCDTAAPRLELRQTRSLPIGSTASTGTPWQIPVCVRYGTAAGGDQTCTLLTEARGSVSVAAANGRCPTWVMPNAAAAGYYRFSLSAAGWQQLMTGAWPQLSALERLAVADSLNAGFDAATLPAADVFATLPLLAADPSRPVAISPMPLIRFARDHLVTPELRPRLEAFARELYAPLAARLGWDLRADDTGESKLLRARVVDFLAMQGRDPEVRRQLAERGRLLIGTVPASGLQLGSVTPELVDVGLVVAVEDGDAAFFDQVVAQLRATPDDFTRLRLIGALASTPDPVLAARARDLAISPDVRIGETMRVLWRQVEKPHTRQATWEWLQANFDAVVAHLPERDAGELPWLAGGFCDAAHADAVAAFFASRIESLPGGPRNLAGAIESIRLCAARAAAQRASLNAFFTTKAPRHQADGK